MSGSGTGPEAKLESVGEDADPESAAAWSLRPDDLLVTPEPTAEELTAIIAAYEALWPRTATCVTPVASPRWRYAGRPWARRHQYGGWS